MLPYLLLINIKERPFYHEVFLSILNFFKTLPNLFSSLKGKTINFHIISLTLLFFVFQPVMPSLANKLDQRKISQEDISYLFDESNIDLENNDSLILALSEEEMQELEGKSLIASTFKTLGSIGSIFIRFSPTANAILVEAVTDIKAVLAMTTNYIYRYNNFITTEQEVYEVVIERIKELSEQIGSIESVQPSEELIAYRDTIIKPELERVESDSSLILVTSPNFKHYQLEEKVLSRKKLDAHIEVKEIIDAYLSKDYLTGEFKSFVRDFGEDISFIDLLKVYTGFENLVDISIVLREEIHNRDLSDEAYLDLLVATLKISQLAQNDIDVILSRNPDDEKALKAQKLLKVASNRDLLAEQLNGKKQNLVEAEDYVRIYSMGTEEAQARIAEGHIDKSEKEIGIMEYDFKIDTIDSELKKIQNEIKDIQTINYQLRKEYSELESRSENLSQENSALELSLYMVKENIQTEESKIKIIDNNLEKISSHSKLSRLVNELNNEKNELQNVIIDHKKKESALQRDSEELGEQLTLVQAEKTISSNKLVKQEELEREKDTEIKSLLEKNMDSRLKKQSLVTLIKEIQNEINIQERNQIASENNTSDWKGIRSGLTEEIENIQNDIYDSLREASITARTLDFSQCNYCNNQ